MRLYVSVAFMIAVTACTQQPPAEPASTPKSEFIDSSKFVSPYAAAPGAIWNSRTMTNGQGRSVCTVSSGPNGISFVVQKSDSGNVVSVQSNRRVLSGTWMTATVNGHRYETKEAYFSARDAVAMAQDFSAGGTAYVEWSELSTHNRIRHNADYSLDGFKALFDRCL